MFDWRLDDLEEILAFIEQSELNSVHPKPVRGDIAAIRSFVATRQGNFTEAARLAALAIDHLSTDCCIVIVVASSLP